MTKAEKNAAWCRDWYQRNKKRKYEMQRRRVQDLRRYIDEVKASAGCLHCGEPDPVCLIFHHRDPTTKLFDVALGATGAYGIDAIRAEIAKCDVLCANCHLKHHWEERQQAKRKPN